MGVLIEILRRVDFLAGLPDDEVDRFMVLGRCSVRKRRHVFWRTGDDPRELVVIVSGEAKTVARSEDGREVIHAFFGPGDCVGLAGALDGLPRPHDAEVARGGEFLVIGRDALWSFLERLPHARRAALSMLGRMYRRSLRDHDDVVFHKASQRVARFLLERICVRQSDGARVLVDATLAELAARVGMVPEVASRVIARLRRAGLVRRRRRTVFVTDWAGLRAVAGLDVDDASSTGLGPTARERTLQFFIPAAAESPRRLLHEEASVCIAALGELALCRARGCPVALGAVAHGPSHTPGAGARALRERSELGANLR